jgi:chlorobactene glucosyltransferase
VIWLAGLGLSPWVVVAGVLALWVREPPPLSPAGGSNGEGEAVFPSVSIIVPARNEARGIEACLRSLALQEYPDFEIVVVDDRSVDATRMLAEGVVWGNARRIEVVAGEPLPDGWFGKPWACAQGAAGADSELLLFTDADTYHGPSLLRSAVLALAEDDASAVSLIGRQELGTFGERLVQPQIFAVLGLRYLQLDRVHMREVAEDAIANGQYILVRRATYEDVGGHESVKGEVVEDLRLAQELAGAGHRLSLRREPDRFSTRMYHSLGEVLDGWTKNIAIGARQSAGWWGRFALMAIVAYVAVLWLLPPSILAVSGLWVALGGAVSEPLWSWALGAALIGVLTWGGVYHRFRVSPAYGLLFPFGAALVGWIALRSGWRGDRRVDWKGRRYSGGRALGDSV